MYELSISRVSGPTLIAPIPACLSRSPSFRPKVARKAWFCSFRLTLFHSSIISGWLFLSPPKSFSHSEIWGSSRVARTSTESACSALRGAAVAGHTGRKLVGFRPLSSLEETTWRTVVSRGCGRPAVNTERVILENLLPSVSFEFGFAHGIDQLRGFESEGILQHRRLAVPARGEPDTFVRGPHAVLREDDPEAQQFLSTCALLAPRLAGRLVFSQSDINRVRQ